MKSEIELDYGKSVISCNFVLFYEINFSTSQILIEFAQAFSTN